MQLAAIPPTPSAPDRPAPSTRSRTEASEGQRFEDVLRGGERRPEAARDGVGSEDPAAGDEGAGVPREIPSEEAPAVPSDVPLPSTPASEPLVQAAGVVGALLDGTPAGLPPGGAPSPAPEGAAPAGPALATPGRTGGAPEALSPVCSSGAAPTPTGTGRPSAEATEPPAAEGVHLDLEGSQREPAVSGLPRAPQASPAPQSVNPSSPPSPPPAEPGPQERLAADVLRQVRVALDPARRSVTVRLDPRELGSISIRLDLGVGRVRAVLRAETPMALELLERHLPELRAALAAQGLEGEDFDLGLADRHDPRADRDPQERHPHASRSARGDEPLEVLQPRPWSDGAVLDTYA